MGRFLNVTIGYEMEEEEMLKIIRENCMSKEEFETEDAAYEYAAETKFNYGAGVKVES